MRHKFRRLVVAALRRERRFRAWKIEDMLPKDDEEPTGPAQRAQVPPGQGEERSQDG